MPWEFPLDISRAVVAGWTQQKMEERLGVPSSQERLRKPGSVGGPLLTARSRKRALSAAAPIMPTITLAAVMPAAAMKVMLNLWARRQAG